jgi:monothiol glutaredoxin
MEDLKQQLHQLVTTRPVVLFMKGTKSFPTCGFSGRAVQILKACGVDFVDVNVLADPEIVPALRDYANWPTIPVLYIEGEFVGGADIMTEMYQSGELQQKLAGLAKAA